VGAGTGSTLVLDGGAGLGKTTLLHRLREMALARGIEVLYARGGELEQAVPGGLPGSCSGRPHAALISGSLQRWANP
jgi:hypothetical protein